MSADRILWHVAIAILVTNENIHRKKIPSEISSSMETVISKLRIKQPQQWALTRYKLHDWRYATTKECVESSIRHICKQTLGIPCQMNSLFILTYRRIFSHLLNTFPSHTSLSSYSFSVRPFFPSLIPPLVAYWVFLLSLLFFVFPVILALQLFSIFLSSIHSSFVSYLPSIQTYFFLSIYLYLRSELSF